MKFTTTIGHIFLVEIAQNRIFLAEVRAQTPLSPIWWRHLWARSRPKLDVKKTHTQYIKIPYLYTCITIGLLCLYVPALKTSYLSLKSYSLNNCSETIRLIFDIFIDQIVYLEIKMTLFTFPTKYLLIVTNHNSYGVRWRHFFYEFEKGVYVLSSLTNFC